MASKRKRKCMKPLRAWALISSLSDELTDMHLWPSKPDALFWAKLTQCDRVAMVEVREVRRKAKSKDGAS